ncbi:S-adenosyl-L-methionine-dependent methyltransferase [Xylariales sp. AK1849]|nr:S-adenosyl-L-methionine-dependent methyltransferase [Xylariales sp. AK1849]
MGDKGEKVANSVVGQQVDGDNLAAWEDIATYWDQTLGNGNDMYHECLLPAVQELANVQEGERALDLGTGSAVIAAVLATCGAHVTAVDGSKSMLEKAEIRAKDARLNMTFEVVNLLDTVSLDAFGQRHPRFDLITCSMTLKELPDLEPLAAALPKLLAPRGRVVMVNLHPVFSKPAGHRVMEILENDETGKQESHRHIKVSRYLDIQPVKSEALRGQPYPLTLFHRPFWSLMDPFFRNGLVMDAMREPGFTGSSNPSQLQSYHNFGQFPMLLAFRLRLLPPIA